MEASVIGQGLGEQREKLFVGPEQDIVGMLRSCSSLEVNILQLLSKCLLLGIWGGWLVLDPSDDLTRDSLALFVTRNGFKFVGLQFVEFLGEVLLNGLASGVHLVEWGLGFNVSFEVDALGVSPVNISTSSV